MDILRSKMNHTNTTYKYDLLISDVIVRSSLNRSIKSIFPSINY